MPVCVFKDKKKNKTQSHLIKSNLVVIMGEKAHFMSVTLTLLLKRLFQNYGNNFTIVMVYPTYILKRKSFATLTKMLFPSF